MKMLIITNNQGNAIQRHNKLARNICEMGIRKEGREGGGGEKRR
jgi:hypothetical protein